MKTTYKNLYIMICTVASVAYSLVNPHANALSIGKRTIRRPFFRKPVTSLTQPSKNVVNSDDGELFHMKHISRDKRPRRMGRRGVFRGRRLRDTQLNYKETAEELTDVQKKKRLRRVLSKIRLRSLRRKRSAPFALGEESLVVNDKLFVLGDIDENSLATKENSYEAVSHPVIAPQKVKTKRSVIRRKREPKAIVSNIHELREAILDRGLELRDVELQYSPPPSLVSSNSTTFQHFNKNYALDKSIQNSTNSEIFSHDVLNLLHKRYHSHSTPANRSVSDNATLALAIEGGGMRGAVSGGMAAAIVCLGLSNAFDSIYGSSAGSIIGSYFVSRQLYLDVYTDVIPAGFDLFVSKAKIIGDIFRNMFVVMKGGSVKRLNGFLFERFKVPRGNEVVTLQPTREGGLNISFVLDSIMCPEKGLRPLDIESFAHNDDVQPLRIVSSAVDMETGMLRSIVFGSKEGHFCDGFANIANGRNANSSELYPEILSAEADEHGYRRGLWACLGASMSVPGAAGSPFPMDLPSSTGAGTSRHLCFDAFCYEPVPYRSAVAEGATHVLALRSKPANYEPKTRPTLYERAVAPLYFRSNKAETVAKFFESGGQQYLYAEDVLTCDEGFGSTEPIAIPPTDVLYGGPQEKSEVHKDRGRWKRAHLLPITVPANVPELGTLEDDRDEIIAGIRSGFAAVSL